MYSDSGVPINEFKINFGSNAIIAAVIIANFQFTNLLQILLSGVDSGFWIV